MESQTIKSAALCLTHNCNLRCRYCYAGAKAARPMEQATAHQTIDFLASQSGDHCTATFFGGEPLLELDLMRDIVRFSRDRFPGRFDFRMATNGTLLNLDTLQFLKENDIIFSVSLDGSLRQHDANRIFSNDRGSYQRVADNLPDILTVNPYTVAVSVVTPTTVTYLSEGVKHLFGLGFRYVVQTLNYAAGWTGSDLKRMKAQYKSLSRFYFDSLKAGHKIYYSPFDARIQTWAQKPYAKGELCDIARSEIAVAASGRIYPCVQFVAEDDAAAQETAIGDVWRGFDSSQRSWFIEQNNHEVESCVGCALYGRCATYCGCVNWHTTGHVDRIPPIICEHERMFMPIVDELANRLWKHNGELFKRKFYEKSFPISSYIEDCLMTKRG